MYTIHTLDARDNFLLDVCAAHFSLSPGDIRREVAGAHQAASTALLRRGIDYHNLRSALVPQPTRTEVVLLFDTLQISTPYYGHEVAGRVLPLLERDQNLSILDGDLIHSNQSMARAVLAEFLVPVREFELRDTSQLYCVYINNLSLGAAERINAGLSTYEAYVGYVPMSYATAMKDWVSRTLIPSYVKNGGKFITRHAEDHDESSNINSPGWPLSEHHYEIISIAETYFNLFLSYKVERAVKPGFESDNLYALYAISADPVDLEHCNVHVEDAKLEYLRTHKFGSLEAAGLEGTSSSDLAELIKSKIRQNYLYNLRFDPDRGQSFFNIVVEVGSSSSLFRLLVGLEYQAKQRQMRVVTMF